jgi:hypothetical protein
VFDRIETFCGKWEAYFARALRNEQGRNIRDEEIEDRNYLGGTPKEAGHPSGEKREEIRTANRMAADTDDPAMAAAIFDSADPEEIALAQEEERRMEAELDRRSGELPSDQRALFESWRAGESPTDARERLGLPKSTEIALRGRFERWAREWRAQQAS